MSNPAVMADVGSNRRQNLFDVGIELEQIFTAYESICLSDNLEDNPNAFLAEALTKYFDEVGDKLNDKIDAYANLIAQRDAHAKIRKEESKRLHALAETDENLVKALKGRLKEFLLLSGNTKLETKFHKVWLQNNGGVVPFEWKDGAAPNPGDPLCDEEIEERFLRRIVTLNEESIRTALDAGETIPFVKLGQRGQHVRIK